MSVLRSSVSTHSRLNQPSLFHTGNWNIVKTVCVIAGLYSALAFAPGADALNLTIVGDGWCLDASGRFYDYVSRLDVKDSSGNLLSGEALKGECNSWCGQKPDGLVGVNTVELPGYSECHCWFSDPIPTGLTITSYNPAGYRLYGGNSGSGQVTSVYPLTGRKCYRVETATANPTAPPTTSSPTAKPTAPPTTSSPTANPTAPPTTSSPTAKPTLAPTSTPSESPTKKPTNQPTRSFEGIAGKTIAAPNCTIDIEGPELTCTSTINPDDIFAGAALFMTVLQGSCEAVTEASTEQSSATSAIQVTAACKNGGSCTSEHCVRIDIKAQGISLLAAMFKVASTLLFDTTGAFSAVVETEAFTSTDKTATAAVSRTLNATLGMCGSSEAPTPLNIGDVVYVCISSQDDVKLNLINVVANPGEQVLVANGTANFVTSFENGANPVTLSTLMIPVFYDLQGGNAGSITISGTASIIYSRRLESGRFLQDDEEGKFIIEIPLADRSVPVVVDSVAEENTGHVLGLSRVAGAGIVTVLGMLY